MLLRLAFCALLAAPGLVQAAGREFAELQELDNSTCSNLPANITLVNQTYVLPDPFTFLDGTPVTNMANWTCRAAEIRALFMQYELGTKPPKPPVLKYSVNSATTELTITAGLSATNTISFTGALSYQENPSTPIPAIIVFDGLSLPRPSGVVTITLNTGDIAQQNDDSSRGKGKFFDLYGSNASAGALMAWAWAVSRVIDVIEEFPALMIDPTRIAVTGCSRDGKGAIVAGAFDERIALTIPQESGSGGDACWRISREMLVDQDLATQTAWEIVQENVWMSPNFAPFAANNYTIGLLPVDHHELAGLIAPRGLYSTSNIGFLWLGDQSNYDCMVTANKIYQALGVPDHQGFSQDGPHDHCSFPSDQNSEVTAFYNKFLFNQTDANTTVMRTTGTWTYNATWAPWTSPVFTS